jgi:hypothetical protein
MFPVKSCSIQIFLRRMVVALWMSLIKLILTPTNPILNPNLDVSNYDQENLDVSNYNPVSRSEPGCFQL